MSNPEVIAQPEPVSRPRVLCVDDEPHVLAAIADMVRRQFDVSVATSGAEGLRMLQYKGPFTVVVSDFRMPGMNGAEFLAQVRAVAPEAIRMLLTGQASADNAMAAVNDGNIFRFLTKPCPPKDLIRALDDAVEQARLVTADRALVQRKLDAISGHLVRSERLASVGTMAAAVGHELNNVLMPFEGALALVEEATREGKPLSEADVAWLREVKSHLAMHARNLLTLGRPAQAAPSSAADLRTALSGVLDMLRLAGVLRQVQVHVEMPSEPIGVAVSQPKLEQVLVNLVKNAIEALGEAGRPEPLIRVAVAPAGPGLVRCSVSDNGAGIPAASLPHLFEPYYTTKAPDRGTGLGLFVVRQIARDAGGDVSVESEEGRGTTFIVTLPGASDS